MLLSWNLGTLTSWNTLGHTRPVTGLLYLYLYWKQADPMFAVLSHTSQWRLSHKWKAVLQLVHKFPALHETQRFLTVFLNINTNQRKGKSLPVMMCTVKKYRFCLPEEGPIMDHNTSEINLLAPEFFFLILAHPVYKMWIIQEPNTLKLLNKLHFEEGKMESIYHV